VATGKEAATVLSVGARGSGTGVSRGVTYPVSEAAARHGISVEQETDDPVEAYVDVPRARSVRYGGWLS
jgi:hypothetical protein